MALGNGDQCRPMGRKARKDFTFFFIVWCRRRQQDEMIERDVMQWLVQLLRNCDMISDYMLEYAVALLMNLCLRSAGQQL